MSAKIIEYTPTKEIYSMNILTKFEKKIRQHNDVYAVFDVLFNCGCKNPRDAWSALTDKYPEVVGKTDNFKFPGRGQRLTPVATKQNMLYIIGLLPGAVGQKYREESLNLVTRFLAGDVTLAEDIIDRTDNLEGVKRLTTKAKGREKQLIAYHNLHDQLALHGAEDIHHATVNKHNNGLAGIPKTRKHGIDERQAKVLTVIETMEELALMGKETNNAWHAVNTCKKAGNEGKQFLLKQGMA